MRRALTFIAPLALLLAAVSPAAAAPPTREDQQPFSFDYAAGEVCDFDLRVETVVITSKTVTFSRHDGAFRQISTGHIVERVTNLDTAASLTLDSSGPAKVTINAAGHVVLSFGGASVLPFFDGDVTGRGLLLIKGGGAEFEIGDDGFFFVRADMPAHVVDLCAALS